MPIQLANSDFLVIGGYLLLLAGIAFYSKYRQSQTADFLLAGRKLTLPVFVGTLVATWYGGVLGIAEQTGRVGLGTWLTQGILWYSAYLLFALFFATRIHKLPYYTVSDILAFRFGNRSAMVGAVFTYLMVNPAPYLLSLGVVLQIITGWPFFWAIWISTIFIAGYTMASGFRGIVYSDCFQCVWMYLAYGLLAGFALYGCGGYSFLVHNLTLVPGYEHHLKITGNMPFLYIVAWGGMAMWVFVDPNFYQRCYAASSPSVARWGIILSTVCWAIFDILSCGTALYAFAAQNHQLIAFADPKMAHLALADHFLPSPLKGLFLAGVVANIISTADSFLFAGASNISRDFYWRYCNPQASDTQMIRATRWGIVATALLAAVLAIFYPSVVDLWYTIGTIGLSGLLWVMIVALFAPSYSDPRAALSSMISGGSIALAWFGWGLRYGSYPLALEPLYPGLIVAIIGYGVMWNVTKSAE